MAINWNTQPTSTPSKGIKWNQPTKTPPPPPEPDLMEKAASGFNTVFGGGKIGEAIGTQIAKARATPEERKFITPGPSAKEIVGDVIRVGANFIPAGGAGLGMAGKIGIGLGTGYAFDVGNDMAENKSASEILTPGIGTLVGGLVPPVLGKTIPLVQGLRKGATKTAEVGATKLAENIVEKRVSQFDKVFNTSGPLRRLKIKSDSKGYNISQTLAANDKYIPVPDGGKITYEGIAEPMANLQKDIKYRAEAVNAVVDSFGQKVNINDWRATALKEIDDLKLKGDEYNRVKSKIDKDFEVYAKEFADADGNIDLSLVNKIKSQKYSNINWKDADPDLYTADRAISRASKDIVESEIDKAAALYGDDVSIKNLNYELGRLYDTQEALEQMAKSGVTLQNGRFGRWGARAVGAVAGSGGGPVGSIAGVMTADSLVSLMQNNYFRKNKAVTALIGEIKQADPKLYEEAMKLAQKNQSRFALPAGNAAYRSEVSSGAAMPVLPTGRNIDPVGFPKVGQSTPALPQSLESSSQLPMTNPINATPNIPNISPTVPPKNGQSSINGAQALAAVPGIKEDENGDLTVNPTALATALALGTGRVSPKQAQALIARLNKQMAKLTNTTFTDPKKIAAQEYDLKSMQGAIRLFQRYLK